MGNFFAMGSGRCWDRSVHPVFYVFQAGLTGMYGFYLAVSEFVSEYEFYEAGFRIVPGD